MSKFSVKIKDGEYHMRLKNLHNFLDKQKDGEYIIEVKKRKNTRTNQQNRALHLYFTHLAERLNEAGLDMRVFIREGIDIPWTGENIKEYIWKPVMKKYLNIESTTEMKTTEIDKIYDIINREMAGRGIDYVPFPSNEQLMF